MEISLTSEHGEFFVLPEPKKTIILYKTHFLQKVKITTTLKDFVHNQLKWNKLIAIPASISLKVKDFFEKCYQRQPEKVIVLKDTFIGIKRK